MPASLDRTPFDPQGPEVGDDESSPGGRPRFAVIVPSPDALTPEEAATARVMAWPIRVHFRSEADFVRFIERRSPEPARRGAHDAPSGNPASTSVRQSDDTTKAKDSESTSISPVLISADEAAALLGISRTALYSRIERGQVKGVVKSGRRIQFHRETMLAKLAKGAK